MIASNHIKHYIFIALLWICFPLHASFIEQTLGAAVVKDATAVYFNPAALTIISKQQLILLATSAQSQFKFSGSVQNIPSGSIESGATTTTSNFSLPSMYLSIPVNEQLAAGFAIVANDFNRDLEDTSILRYVQARNQTHDVDLISALGIKINEFFSIGGNLNSSYAHLIQEPISGIPSLTIPESRSLNNSKDSSLGGDIGFLIQLPQKTSLGFNYRSAITYHLHGTSSIINPQVVVSDNYHFTYWTPARSVLSLSHFLNDKLGFIGTIQYLQWDIFKESNIYNFVSQSGSQVFIVPQARINYYFHNSWLATMGTIYNVSSKWKVRVAATYNQSPSNDKYQIGTGNSLVVGFSTGYQLLKQLTVDCGFGHAFFKRESINIETARNIISGINQGTHDAVSLKLTLSA